jgi:hypothetical protein
MTEYAVAFFVGGILVLWVNIALSVRRPAFRPRAWWHDFSTACVQNEWLFIAVIVFSVGGIIFFHPELLDWLR